MKNTFSKKVEDLLVKALQSALSGKTLQQFYPTMTKELSQHLNCDLVWVGHYDDEKGNISVLSSSGSLNVPVKKGTVYTTKEKVIRPIFNACKKNEVSINTVLNVQKDNFYQTCFSFAQKNKSCFILTFITKKAISDVVLTCLKNFIKNLNKITQLSDEKQFLLFLKENINSDYKQKTIDYASNYDLLTNLPNRSLFLKKLQELQKKKSKFFAVLFIDLAAFSRFNNAMGYDIGDQVLKMQAERLLSCLSRNDTLARIDSDQFGIVLSGASSIEAVRKYAEQIIRTLELPLLINDKEVFINSYIGISLYPHDTKDPETLLNYADAALSEAKRVGANNYTFFSAQLNQEMMEKISLQNDMRKALAEKQFFVEYQPQLDLKTGRISGFEALVRWLHPKKGLIPPALFIPIAEETGFIIPLTEYIMDVAFKQSKLWNEADFGKLTVAVNLSAAQFDNPKTIYAIEQLMNKKHIKADYIELELTESLLIKHLEKASHLLKELASLGVKLAMDDFGTGYSSLSYLTRLPFNKIKIDRSFIQPLQKNKQDQEIVRAIIDLGHTLGLSVLAEGCENKSQFEKLKKLNCDSIQGFYVSRSLSSKDAEQLLQKYNKN